MWLKIAKGVLKYRLSWIAVLAIVTLFMGYQASKVQLSYDFSRAIPTDHPQYLQYLDFKKTFGEDGNLLTIGFQTDSFFQLKHFTATSEFQKKLKKVEGVEDIISANSSVYLKRNDSTSKLDALRIFPDTIGDQATLDSLKNIFLSLPFYKGLMYNPTTHAYVVGVRINKDVLASKAREKTVGDIEQLAKEF
ncbi:MAG: hypothetical protein RLY11_1178, partial [Bacteroidota bacterium]